MKHTILIARILFVLIMTYCGFRIAPLGEGMKYTTIFFFASLLIILLEHSTRIISSKKMLFAAAGLFAGLVMSQLVYPTFSSIVEDQQIALLVSNLLFGYMGVLLFLRHADRFSLSRLKFIVQNPAARHLILDTNVIIDGRIVDLWDTGFLSGRVIVPDFVLQELQMIADSRDSYRRSMGRRGLQNLENLKRKCPELEIYEGAAGNHRDVDQKLIALAREIKGEIVTNDYNLNKVASLHQVKVLNINDLAQVVRPPVQMGDQIELKVLREGKDPEQGVGYLEDGTMVVVEDGSAYIGKMVKITITSILQTSAGRMIFGRVHERDRETAPSSGRH
ncbi:MAG: TRAM domain-containing protein [Candidatus Sumerlaeia bacterium]